jgi:hypothetical protein
MTEEIKTENQEVEKVSEPSPIEVKAREMGWRPKEEFHGDEEDFVDAKEFVHRQPLFEKIESQSRQLKNVQKTLDALKGHYSQVKESEYKRALASLEAQKESAINDADGTKAIQVDRQIRQVEREFEQIKREHAEPHNTGADPQEFVSWKAKNTWYESDETMRMVADSYGQKLAREGMSPGEVLKEVTKKVRAEFGHKFRNPNKDDAPEVNTSSPRGKSAAKADDYALTDEERKIMNTLVRDGTLTKEKYIADLKAIKASGR